VDTLSSGVTQRAASGSPWLYQAFASCPFRILHTFSLLRPARHYSRLWIQRPSSKRRRDFNPPEQCAAQRTLWPLLTSGGPSQRLATPVAQRQTARPPGYCALTSRLCLSDIRHRVPCKYWALHLLACSPRRAASIRSLFSGQRFAYSFLQIPPRDDTLAVQLTFPCRVCRGLPPQVSAPCRAHQKTLARIAVAAVLLDSVLDVCLVRLFSIQTWQWKAIDKQAEIQGRRISSML